MKYIIAFLLCFSISSLFSQSRTIYVNQAATGANNGASWNDAYTNLQSALGEATGFNELEIWVAAGVYTPIVSPQSLDRNASFVLKSGVRLIGGFVGNETVTSQRMSDSRGLFFTNESKLNGDIGTLGDNADNSYSVVILDSTGSNKPIVLDGFSIVMGNANTGNLGRFDSYPDHRAVGGGIFVVSRPVSDTIRGCAIADNRAKRGGALYIRGNSPRISECLIVNNRGSDLGGAIYLANANPEFSKCQILGNEAQYSGGGVFSWHSSASFDQSLFQSNRCSSEGGAVYCGAIEENLADHFTISASEFKNNQSRTGAALYFQKVKSKISNSIFSDNSASESHQDGKGGAIHAKSTQLLIEDSDFLENLARVGGGLYIESSLGMDTILNCTFYDNSAFEQGGGIYKLFGDSTEIIQDCDFTNNSARQGGGLICLNGSPGIRNTSFTDNYASNSGGGFFGEFCESVLTNCLFEGNSSTNRGGGLHGSFGDLTLVDCEFTANTSVHGGGLGYFLGNPTILDCSFENNEAHSLGGSMYVESSSLELKNTSFESESADRGGAIYFTGVRAQIDSCVFRENTAEGGGAMFIDGSDPVLVNNQFSNNESTGWGGAIANNGSSSPKLRDCYFFQNSSPSGGAIHNERFCEPEFNNCTFESNTAGPDGGGAMLNTPQSRPIVDSCTFIRNKTIADRNQPHEGGGAIFNWGSSAIFTFCDFIENTSNKGGAISIDEGSPIIQNCTFTRDSSFVNGGAIFSKNNSNPFITNSSFIENNAGWLGGVLYSTSSTAQIVNSTFSRNYAANAGGVLRNLSSSEPIEIIGSTIYQNSSLNDGGAFLVKASTLFLKNTVIAENVNGQFEPSNISLQENASVTSLGYNFFGENTGSNFIPTSTDIVGSPGSPIDPMLDTLGYYGGPTPIHPPLPGSPAIDAGEPLDSTDILTDQRGFSRITGSRDTNIDIGAFEHQSTFIIPIDRSLCTAEEEFLILPTILIQDSTGGAFGDGENLSLEFNAPDGVVFEAGSGNISCEGLGLSDCEIQVTDDLITLSYTRTYDTLLNSLKITDIRIKVAEGANPAAVSLLRTGGNALQYDNRIADGQPHARVQILPTFELAERPYDDNFEGQEAFWFVPDSNSIWQQGVPAGGLINRAASGQQVWMTNLDAAYPARDTSWVGSSCFDFRGIENPLLSVNVWSDAEEGFDGTVLQFSTDAGDSWQTVGEEGRGFDWYNSSNISANPGQQITDANYGWTGRDTTWKRARIQLAPIQGEDAVRFRFAFASISLLDEDQSNNGFAFDDFQIGTVNQKILLEHFSDASPFSGDEKIRNLVESFGTNVIPVQFQLKEGNPFYEKNKSGPRTRALYYGVAEGGVTAVNGAEYLGATEDLNEGPLERGLFAQSGMGINIDTTLSEAIEITSFRDVMDEVIVYVAVVENTPDQPYAFRTFIPNAGGISFEDWPSGEQTAFELKWDQDAEAPPSIVDNYDSLQVIVFVQNKESKEVYQVASEKIWSGLLDRNALKEGSFPVEKGELRMYPNPVINRFFIDFGAVNEQPFSLTMTDMKGRIVWFEEMLSNQSQYKVDISRLALGMYYLTLDSGEENLLRQKVIVRD